MMLKNKKCMSFNKYKKYCIPCVHYFSFLLKVHKYY